MRIARSTLIGTAVALALFGRDGAVQAQASGDATTSKSNDTLQEVVVYGIRASLRESLQTKREATGVLDALTAEDVGKFPDKNLAVRNAKAERRLVATRTALAAGCSVAALLALFFPLRSFFLNKAFLASTAFSKATSTRIFFDAASRNRISASARTSITRVSPSVLAILDCSASEAASLSDTSSMFKSPRETW